MQPKDNQIRGKWNGNLYHIEKELGRGANGVVYLVRHEGTSYALKVGEDTFSMTSEVNVLESLQKAQGLHLGPSIYDVDDWQQGTDQKPFYVMNVIEGTPLLSFVKQKGKAWIPVLMIQLLSLLQELHNQGWVFGDLKPDHLQVCHHPPKIVWFDVGGMTRMGRAIKEYTENYDRGYWHMGDRRAEPSYDLFSLAMIAHQLTYGALKLPTHMEPATYLKSKVGQHISADPYQNVIWKAMSGQYDQAQQMKQDWLKAWYLSQARPRHNQRIAAYGKQPRGHDVDRTTHKPKRKTKTRPKTATATNPMTKGKKKDKKKGVFSIGKVVPLFFFTSFVLFVFVLLLFTQAFF